MASRGASVLGGDPHLTGVIPRTPGVVERTGIQACRSRDLYAEAFEASLTNYYVGVNAVAKSIFLHEMDVGQTHARRVQSILGTGAQLYSAAVAIPLGREVDHESTWKQASRLVKQLSPTEADVEAVARAFRHPTQQPVTP